MVRINDFKKIVLVLRYRKPSLQHNVCVFDLHVGVHYVPIKSTKQKAVFLLRASDNKESGSSRVPLKWTKHWDAWILFTPYITWQKHNKFSIALCLGVTTFGGHSTVSS